jgi:hypothetical protein
LEVVIEGVIEGDSTYLTEAVVEPSFDGDKNSLIVARALVDPSNCTLPLRIVNTSNTELVIYANIRLATCQAYSSVMKLNADGETDEGIRMMRKVDETEHNLERNDDTLPNHLINLFESSCTNLSEEQSSQLKGLLKRHSGAFAKSKNDLGCSDLIKHKINTGDAIPIKQNPRRLPLAKRQEADSEIQRMLDNDIIEPSKSPWASRIALVPKNDGTVRFCVDFRKLNNMTKKDSYPLPRIDDCLDALRGAKWFSTVDLQSGYWQVQMDECDKEKTAFVTCRGLYQFRVMAFGLCNAGACFERLMVCVLAGLNCQIYLLYLDDVIIFAATFEQVIAKINEHNLKISPSKCSFFQEKVNFLGHVVSGEGISTDPEKIAAVTRWPIPKSVHDVRSFLGICSYYRRFIKNFSEIARPLYKLTEKGEKFNWSQECQVAMTTLQRCLTSAPILCYPDTTKTFILDTDASGFGMGAVLSQIHDNQEHVVAYYSKIPSKPERQYCVTRRELLAIVQSIKHFHHYLYGTQLLVRRDHGDLNWLLNFKIPEGQMARWLEVLASYHFTIQHRPGRQHSNADGSSRRPCEPCNYVKKKTIKLQIKTR